MENIKQFIAGINLFLAIIFFIWILLDLVETEFDDKSIMKLVAMILNIIIFVVLI